MTYKPSSDETMRLDVFLSRVRLIMPRTSAKRACDNGIVSVQGRLAKPSTEVCVDDIITIQFTNQDVTVRITRLPGKSVPKKQAENHYTVITDYIDGDTQGTAC